VSVGQRGAYFQIVEYNSTTPFKTTPDKTNLETSEAGETSVKSDRQGFNRAFVGHLDKICHSKFQQKWSYRTQFIRQSCIGYPRCASIAAGIEQREFAALEAFRSVVLQSSQRGGLSSNDLVVTND
jgi:hypothetical protein